MADLHKLITKLRWWNILVPLGLIVLILLAVFAIAIFDPR